MSASVFTYGTLMFDNIIKSLINRVPPSQIAIAYSFKRHSLLSRPYPAVTYASFDQFVVGRLFLTLTQNELEILDHYEGNEYNRIQINVKAINNNNNNNNNNQLVKQIKLIENQVIDIEKVEFVEQSAFIYVWGLTDDQLLPQDWNIDQFNEHTFNLF
eukprot:TRINITY_DN345_c5_g1_i1.p1 TRINITY_DN345_c5_g1~~TRINITY_DN345_c5_g1_i1.p1  ORF type:complete len:158 (-),score=59.85 TRINITY_DN345_c5_g1_i1:151-624(-)